MGRLTTERLRLEPLTAEHTELLVELDSRPEAAARGIGYWAGAEEGTFVGLWALALDPAERSTAPLPGWEQGEVFYEIDRSAWLER